MAFGASALGAGRALAQAAAPAGPFKLPPLGYANEALEPHIDATTMMIHHDRHHAAYVANANSIAEKWTDMASMPIETILADLQKAPGSRARRRAQQSRRPLEPHVLLGAS